MFSWNDFLYAMFLTKADTKTISVALLSAYGTKDISWGTLGALAHFSTLPIVAMMTLLNRYFVQGVTQGVLLTSSQPRRRQAPNSAGTSARCAIDRSAPTKASPEGA